MRKNGKPRAEDAQRRTKNRRQKAARHGQATAPAVPDPPKPAPCCRNCAYACPLHAALGDCPPRRGAPPCKACRPGVLVCVNHPDAHGQLVRVTPRGVCRNFRRRCKRSTRTRPPTSTDPNVRYIPLTKNQFAIVDAADYERLSRYTWSASHCGRTFYAARNAGGRPVLMHRMIMRPPKGMVVDHIDGNGLNNRRSNLRICTRAENNRNRRPAPGGSSRFRGVYRCRTADRWIANLSVNNRTVYVGLFADEVEAALARDAAARKHHGPYAWLNFPNNPAKAAKSEIRSTKSETNSKRRSTKSKTRASSRKAARFAKNRRAGKPETKAKKRSRR